ncbi:MAG: hypothetical protein E6447_22565, partial [Bradyrhizobium sp.]|nr:hypothetical protein [Bradyrhizobium sp.]
MNNRAAARQREKIMSKKGRQPPAFSIVDERTAAPDTSAAAAPLDLLRRRQRQRLRLGLRRHDRRLLLALVEN